MSNHKTRIDFEALKNLGLLALTNGTEHVFVSIAIQWAEEANKEIDRLRAPGRSVTRETVREMMDDTREVFNASGSETPQDVRDVIEYVGAWLQVYMEKPAQAEAERDYKSEFGEMQAHAANLEAELRALRSAAEAAPDALRELCAAAYQVVGAADGPVQMLDNLTAAVAGKAMPHDPGAGLPWVPAQAEAAQPVEPFCEVTVSEANGIRKADVRWLQPVGLYALPFGITRLYAAPQPAEAAPKQEAVLTDEHILNLAVEAGIVTGENLRRDGYMLHRSVGESANVRSDHLIALVRAALAAPQTPATPSDENTEGRA